MTKMKDIVFIAVVGSLIFACGGSGTTEVAVDTDIPENAIVESYGSTTGFAQAIAKMGDITTLEGDMLDGLKHGSWTEYDNNGIPKTVTTYYMGKKQGLSLTFDGQGYVSVKSNYSDGLLHGEYKVYSRKKVTEERYYVNDQLEGVVKKYYPNGQIMQEAPYEDGQMQGIAKWYDEQGNLSFAYEYDQGELVDKNPEMD